MKITNRELLNSVEVVKKINEMSLPIEISYKVSKNISEIQKELDIYNIEKQKLIEKYGKHEDGKLKTNDDGSIDILDPINWSNDIEKLNSIGIEINIIPIKISEVKNINMTPNEMAQVIFMFE